MIQAFFKNLYAGTMSDAYSYAERQILNSLSSGGNCLDCGAHNGYWFSKLSTQSNLQRSEYFGIEWSRPLVEEANLLGLNVIEGDLNKRLPYPDDTFQCIFGLSVLEHLLYGCRYISDCYRVLKPGGTLVLLTPNISTYFTAALILAGKMPSSGPHPDSNRLLKMEEVIKASPEHFQPDAESDTPEHRHLVVFSYRVLKSYLEMLQFSNIQGKGFGLYPFPRFIQPVVQRIDPWHCHQMVFTAQKKINLASDITG